MSEAAAFRLLLSRAPSNSPEEKVLGVERRMRPTRGVSALNLKDTVNAKGMKPIIHKIQGLVIGIPDSGVLKILPLSDSQEKQPLGALSSIQIQLRNQHQLGSGEQCIGKRVMVYVSSLPESPEDILFGTVQILERPSTSDQGVQPGHAILMQRIESPLSRFVRAWTNWDDIPPLFEGVAHITFLCSNTRYREKTTVRIKLRDDGGNISLPDSAVLQRHRLPTLFDTTTHIISLRSSGALCVIGLEDSPEDYVFWVNHQSTELSHIPVLLCPN